jgi:predicted helicase
MSQVLINQYLGELDRLKKVGGYKEKVIDLLARVTTVSVETMRIVDAMRTAAR